MLNISNEHVVRVKCMSARLEKMRTMMTAIEAIVSMATNAVNERLSIVTFLMVG